MYPTDFDLAVFATYQQSELSRVRHQSRTRTASPQVRHALAHTLVALANRLWHPALDAPLARPALSTTGD